MCEKICVYLDFLYYHNDELVYIRDLLFKNFPITYNFYGDALDFVFQELMEKDIIFDIENLSIDFSFGTLEGFEEYISDVPSEMLSRSCCILECYE